LTITGYTGDARGRRIVIPQSYNGIPVTHIGPGAFSNRGIASVYIPYGVTTILSGAFQSNQLSELHFPNSVRDIRSSAFQHNKLAKVALSPRVSVGREAFANNYLEYIHIPGTHSIQDNAFANNRLKYISFAERAFTIFGDKVFENNFFEAVIIPPGIDLYFNRIFAGNPLTSITVRADIDFTLKYNDRVLAEFIPIGYKFEEFYIASGRQAGTYVRTSATSTDWRLLEE
jgi:hypothetical protein